MQRSRRTNPYPFTWEIPVFLFTAVLFLVLMGVQAGRSIANLIAGSGWVFVERPKLITSLGGVLTGQADAGIEGLTSPATSSLLWTCVAVVELLVLIGCVVGLKWGLARWGPGRLHGMATRADAETLLGQTRLRKHAKVIRPDLYGSPKGGRR